MAQTVGFIGLGHMGEPIAKNLFDAGFPLRVFNRTPERAAPLVDAGATLASAPADAAEPGGVVVTMVADDAALEAVTFGDGGFAEVLGTGGLHVSLSTVAPETVRSLAARHAELGSQFVAAPVFGRPEAAAARKLWICASGAPDAMARTRPYLDAIGQGIFEFGDDPGAAAAVKLAGNFLILAAMESMAEAFLLVEREGVDRAAAMRMLTDTLFAAPVYKNYGQMVAARDFSSVGFTAKLGLKDARLVNDTAAARGAKLRVAEIVRGRLQTLVDSGHGEDDWASFTLGVDDDG